MRHDRQHHRRHHLTKRQREVVRLIALGLSNPEIARALGLTERSVRSYITDINCVLGTRDRVHIAVLSANRYTPLETLQANLRAHLKVKDELQPLTECQTEIVRLVACGLTPAQIAEDTGRALPTVDTTLKHIRRRWQAKRRAQLAVLALDNYIAVEEAQAHIEKGLFTW